jgi:hypothetical protein
LPRQDAQGRTGEDTMMLWHTWVWAHLCLVAGFSTSS